MALGDEYFRRPYAPSQETLGLVQEIGPALQARDQARMEEEKHRKNMETQDLQNEQRRQEMPNAPVGPNSQALGEWVKHHMMAHPDYQPGFETRLKAEMSGQGQPGLAAPAGPQGPQGPRGPMQGPMEPPVQNLSAHGMPGMGLYGGGQAPQPQAFGPPQAQMPGVTSSGGLGYTLERQGGPFMPLPAPPTPQPQAPQPQSQQQPMPQVQLKQPSPSPADQGMTPGAASSPFTNADIARYQHMAPFLKLDQSSTKEDPRIAINDANLKFKRESLAQRESSQARADQTKRDLASIMVRLREKLGDTDRKALIEQAKIAAGNYRAEVMAQARQTSGLGGIVYDQQTQAAMGEEHKRALDELEHLDELEKQLNAQPPGQSSSRSTTVKGPNNAQGATKLRGPGGRTGEFSGPGLEDYLKAHPEWSVSR